MVILELDGRFPPGSDLERTWAEGAAAFVPEDLVVGRAIAVTWPVGHARWLPIPATVDAVPAAAAAPAQAAIDAGPEASC